MGPDGRGKDAREKGSVKIIDIITARLDSKTDSYLATLPSLRLNDVRLTPEMVNSNRSFPPTTIQGGSGRPL